MKFDNVRALDDRQKSREKLPIFYGSRDNYYHGFREVGINNTIDEITNNFESGDIRITLHEDNKTITVEDTGRGMPIHLTSEGIPNYEMFFTRLFASGKYDIKDGENSGVNGVGGCVLNYTSLLYNVQVWCGGEEYIIEYENGGHIKTPLTHIGKTDKHGTKITFKLDPECYTNTEYKKEVIEDIIFKVSAVSPKTNIYFTYKDETKLYHYDNIEQYFKKNIEDDCYTAPLRIYDDNDEITKVEFTFSIASEVNNLCYLNRNYLPEDNSIKKGFLTGVKNFIHKYLKDKGLYQKNEKGISCEDVESSMAFLVNVLSSNVEFQSQTKFSTQKKLYEVCAKKSVTEYLELFQIENRIGFERLCNQVLITKRANDKAERSRSEVKKHLSEKADNISTRPEKFVPCRSKNPQEVELILIEGDSAKNPIKSARDPYTMCIYPLKGKIINAIKNSIDSVLANKEVLDIFKILGCGMSYKGKKIKGVPEFDINKCCVDKILITTDRDYDGSHIESLLIALFYTLAPELIKAGKVYILYTPLYIFKVGKKKEFAYSEEERNSMVREYRDKGIKFTENRYKGLGGVPIKVLHDTAMNKEVRKMYQVTWEEVEKGIETLMLCMSDEKLTERKYFLETEGHKYFDYSLLVD